MLCYFLLNAEDNMILNSASAGFTVFLCCGSKRGIGRIIFKIENTNENKVLPTETKINSRLAWDLPGCPLVKSGTQSWSRN